MRYHIPTHLRPYACTVITLDELDQSHGGIWMRGGRDFMIDYLEDHPGGVYNRDMYLLEECANVAVSGWFTIGRSIDNQPYESVYLHTHKRGFVMPGNKLIGISYKTSEDNSHVISIPARAFWGMDHTKLSYIIIPRKTAQ